jgi:hypothetical protein
MEGEKKKTYRTQYGGMMGKYITVEATEGQLECFRCGDDSLYHDSLAYWHEEKDDLVCQSCFKKMEMKDYDLVLTQH